MPKISVVVPVFNAEKYIKECIESLVNQSLKDIEMIFVDDGSTDSSVSIINDYKVNDSRIKLLFQPNSFAGTARNKGMASAEGEYIIFLDADDYFDCEMLEKMYEKAVFDDADVCLCSAKRFDTVTGEITFPKFYLNTEYLPETTPFSADDIKERIFNFTSPAPWNKLFKTDFVNSNNIRFQSIKKTNDLFFVFLNLALAKKITYVNKPFVNYRFGNSKSLQGERDVLNIEFRDALTELKKELQKRNLFIEFEKSYVNRALSTSLYILNSADNRKNYIKTVAFLRDKCFFDFNIAGHTRGYFYNKSDFDVFLDIVNKSGDELWPEYKEALPDDDPVSFDIDGWKNDKPYVNDGSVKISVIVPVYNAADFVEESINSIRNNTFRDIEIICVNDGSTDNSLEILNSLKKQDERIIIIDKPNGGPSDSRNAGLDVARGELVSFVDSDDYVHPKMLEFLYMQMEKNNLDQLYFSAVSVFDNDSVYSEFSEFENLYKRRGEYSGVVTGRELFVKMVNNSEFRPTPWMFISRRSLFEDNNIRFEKDLIHEDNLFVIMCLSYAQRTEFVNAVLYFRRVHNNSIMTGANKIKRIYSYYKIIKILEQFAKKENLKKDKSFFDALKHQLSVMDFNACDIAEKINPQMLEAFSDTLDEDEAIDFYNHINAVFQIRVKNKAFVKKAKACDEARIITEYKYSHFNDILTAENKKLKSQKSELENENLRLKNRLSIKLVKFALKLDEFIAKIRGKR